MKEKLRVGILLDDYNTPAWAYRMLEKIVNSNYATINLIIVNNNSKTEPNKTLISKIKNNKGRIAYLLTRNILEFMYSKLIERGVYLPNASGILNCEELFENIPTMKVKTHRKVWSDFFQEADVLRIKKHNLDVLIRCGFGILRGDVLGSSKYGIWSFHHGDNRINRGGPAGYWESMESWPETGSILQILSEDLDNGKVLYKSFSCTNKMSVNDNKSNYYWKSLSFMTRMMEYLYINGEDKFLERLEHDNRHPEFYSERLYTSPNNYELAKLTLKKIVEKINILHFNKFFFEQWILMYHIKNDFSSSLWRYKKLIPPKDRFWADPHVIFKDDKYYIFIEEYIYQTNVGHISLITMDGKGNFTEPEIVLERPYHLSYPFVFECQDEYYMIPESSANRTIELYKSKSFPYTWEFEMNLMEGVNAVDATVFYHNRKWWMFTNIIENEGASSWDELFLFSSDALHSDKWQPHPQNPVVSDCKSSRPAGKVFCKNGAIYRPSQNCSVRYGYGFNISEITSLDEKSYREVLVSSVKPNWDKKIVGTHTFNRTNALHMIDASYVRRK